MIEFAGKEWLAKEPKFVVVLDNIRSMHNVGAVFRTADGAGIGCLFLCGISSTPPRAEIRKAALGAEEFVPWYHEKETPKAISFLRERGYEILALECNDSSTSLYDFQPGEKTAIIIGNEYWGLDEDTLKLADHICHLPMRGKKISLNVSVAFGIAAYELTKNAF